MISKYIEQYYLISQYRKILIQRYYYFITSRLSYCYHNITTVQLIGFCLVGINLFPQFLLPNYTSFYLLLLSYSITIVDMR